MNRQIVSLAILSIFFAAASLSAQTAAPKVNSSGGTSPHETISNVFDRARDNRVGITYGRPYSKDPKTGEIRKIWGTLVPWDKAWRLGSDEATLLIAQKDMVIGETTVPAGAYTIYMVPSESGVSKLAFSKKLGGWGIPVDEKQDLVRVDLKKDSMEKQIDQLTLAIEPNPAGGGTIKIMWEKTTYSLPFTIKK